MNKNLITIVFSVGAAASIINGAYNHLKAPPKYPIEQTISWEAQHPQGVDQTSIIGKMIGQDYRVQTDCSLPDMGCATNHFLNGKFDPDRIVPDDRNILPTYFVKRERPTRLAGQYGDIQLGLFSLLGLAFSYMRKK